MTLCSRESVERGENKKETKTASALNSKMRSKPLETGSSSTSTTHLLMHQEENRESTMMEKSLEMDCEENVTRPQIRHQS